MKSALLALLLALPLWAAGPTVTYTRNFPGSQPPYFSVSVNRSGALEYKESPQDNHPLKARLSKADTDAIFSMARKLGYFKKPLESHLKVANTGKKTFRYQNGAASSEATFNYSTDRVAEELQTRFENIADTERAYIALNRDVHYYKLGVNDSLAQVEALWLNHQLAAPLQFVPLLDEIVSHQAFMHIMRERAARLKNEFTAAAHVASAGSKPISKGQ